MVPGLGSVTEKYMKTFDGQCVRTLPDFVVTVAGKGPQRIGDRPGLWGGASDPADA